MRADSEVRVVKIYGMLSLAFGVADLHRANHAAKTKMSEPGFWVSPAPVVLGYFIPEQVLYLRNRLGALMAALPDTTDMLSIVLGAGLSLDQAIARVGDEIRFVYPELADEFYWMTLEVQAGQERAVAFQHMAQRTGLMDIRSLASMIVQAERFGTGLSQALRIYADSIRTKRRLEIEATINSAAVKKVFPIVIFILPALFVVVLAPGIISMFRDFQLLR
jgi:tight adherence protein C